MSNELLDAINNLIDLINSCDKQREDHDVFFSGMILHEEVTRFDELDQLVYAAAYIANLRSELPKASVVGRPLSCRGMNGVEFLGKTHLPFDRTVNGLIIYPHYRWMKDMLALKRLVEVRLGSTKSIATSDKPPESNKTSMPRRITVNLKQSTVTLGEQKWPCNSLSALRWVHVLAEHPDDWISGPELRNYDSELDGTQPRKIRKFLPQEILSLIDSKPGKGSRLRLNS